MHDSRRRFGHGKDRLSTGLLLGGVGVLAFLAARALTSSGGGWPDRVPHRGIYEKRSARRSRGREGVVVGRTVTINRPRHELYACWRDFGRLPEFMENVRAVDVIDDKQSRWTIAGPGGTKVEFMAEITEDRPDELVAWESRGGSVRNSGRIVFRDAPAGRGTEVEATIVYDPPLGTVGRLAAKVMQREPNIQARRELKRFKQLMETGEIATGENIAVGAGT